MLKFISINDISLKNKVLIAPVNDRAACLMATGRYVYRDNQLCKEIETVIITGYLRHHKVNGIYHYVLNRNITNFIPMCYTQGITIKEERYGRYVGLH